MSKETICQKLKVKNILIPKKERLLPRRLLIRARVLKIGMSVFPKGKNGNCNRLTRPSRHERSQEYVAEKEVTYGK